MYAGAGFPARGAAGPSRSYRLELDGSGGNPIEQAKLRTQIDALEREISELLNEIAGLLNSLGISTQQNGADGTDLKKHPQLLQSTAASFLLGLRGH